MLSVSRCLDIASHKKSGFQHGGRRHCLFCILPGHLWSPFRREYFHARDLLPVPAAVPTETEGSLQRNAHLPRPLSPVPARFPHGSRSVPSSFLRPLPRILHATLWKSNIGAHWFPPRFPLKLKEACSETRECHRHPVSYYNTK